jgi:hypothetical protein
LSRRSCYKKFAFFESLVAFAALLSGFLGATFLIAGARDISRSTFFLRTLLMTTFEVNPAVNP